MQMVISSDTASIERLFQDLRLFQDHGIFEAVEKGATKLTTHLKHNIAQGKDASGGFYPEVKEVTMESPIAYGGAFRDTRIRRDVSTNRTAMNVTGETKNSLYQKRTGNGVEIGLDDPRSILVLESNARNPGNVSKPKRDPVGLNLRNATEFEFDIIADQVEAAIDRIISGI